MILLIGVIAGDWIAYGYSAMFGLFAKKEIEAGERNDQNTQEQKPCLEQMLAGRGIDQVGQKSRCTNLPLSAFFALIGQFWVLALDKCIQLIIELVAAGHVEVA